MKARRVVVSLELSTDAPLSKLRSKKMLCLGVDGDSYVCKILQAQANSIEDNRGRPATRRSSRK